MKVRTKLSRAEVEEAILEYIKLLPQFQGVRDAKIVFRVDCLFGSTLSHAVVTTYEDVSELPPAPTWK